MDFASFKQSLSADTLPPEHNILLRALWYDAKGDWHTAHDLINDLEDKDAAWVHAYLHRKEGDTANAGYWYRRAGKEPANVSLAEEWEMLTDVFLHK